MDVSSLGDDKKPLLNATLRWFLFAMILANISGAMIFPLLAVYLSQLGASVGQIGLVFSVSAIIPLLLQLLGGWLGDSIGRLRTIAIGSVCAVFGYLGMVLAPAWQWVLVALCVENISSAMVGPSFGSFIAEQSPEETRGRVYGISMGLFLVVDVIGPLLVLLPHFARPSLRGAFCATKQSPCGLKRGRLLLTERSQ